MHWYRKRLLIAAFVASCTVSAAEQPQSISAYQQLRDGYRAGDPQRTADAYADTAVYSELYDGVAPRVLIGRPAIAAAFGESFTQFSDGEQAAELDLNFRLVSHVSGTRSHDAGVYRLIVGTGEQAQTLYGKFAATVESGRFLSDVSTNATQAEFESAPGALLFDNEDLSLHASHMATSPFDQVESTKAP